MSIPMPPLVIALIESSVKNKSSHTKELQENLQDRGLMVHAVKDPRVPLDYPCEILMVECSENTLPGLTRQLEALWTQQWSLWYQTQHPKKTRQTGVGAKKKAPCHGKCRR